MKAAKLLFSFILFSILMQAQEVDDMVTYDQKTLDKFLKSKTYVVLDQHKESAFSLALIEVVKEHWKITPFEIIDRAQYNTLQKIKTNSFLTREHIAGDENLISLSLFMGGQKYMDKKGVLLANSKLKHYTATDEDFIYKLPILIQNMQWRLTMIRDQKFESEEDFQAYYEKHKYVLHKNKLYIEQKHLTNKVPDMEKLQKFYKHNVSVVSQEVIEDAILTKDSTVYFLSIVAPAKNWGGQTAYYRVFSTKNGETIVSYERSVSSSAPVGVIGYDLKRFNK